MKGTVDAIRGGDHVVPHFSSLRAVRLGGVGGRKRASLGRAGVINRLRELIAAYDGTAQPSRDVRADDKAADPEPSTTQASSNICPCCGGRMRIVETFARGAQPRSFTAEPAGIDSS